MTNLKTDVIKDKDITASMDKEISIALVLDSYKIKHKLTLWREALDKKPEIEKHYDFVREKKSKGPFAGTLTLKRFYKLKPEFCQ